MIERLDAFMCHFGCHYLMDSNIVIGVQMSYLPSHRITMFCEFVVTIQSLCLITIFSPKNLFPEFLLFSFQPHLCIS